MQPNQSSWALCWRVARKEITLFFASPIAYLFLTAFAAVTLFVFFWGEAFFSRNIADVRPLFESMPVLLIFLASTLTMRLWSEERRTGTLEHVLTQPVPLWVFVAGKFLACLTLLLIALAITLPLPVTVSVLGDLDWGPVLAGYLATLLLGAAYLSIGLFVSARSQNQIVSLISAVALCGLFYLAGTSLVTDFFNNQLGEWLRAVGTGSRFESITRGVVDVRDLYYYLSLILVFLALNTFVLERERWAKGQGRAHHRAWQSVTALLLANLIGANLWLSQVNVLRVDATEGNQYSISDATRNYLNQLQEPLLIRAYFSGKTHPLLAPLVPQLQDLVEEYEVAGKGRVRVEVVDPLSEPELEEEANQKYGIQPVPFQVADRYQASIVSSYFNVLVEYGDEHKVLDFRDLIEVKTRSETELDVQLRNPEHDLTRAIKTVLNSYQAGGNLFDTVNGELAFNAYVSADEKLPPQLREFKASVEGVLKETAERAQGRFKVNFIVPEAEGGEVQKQLAETFGFQPMATSLLSNERFYFYLTLAKGEQVVQIPLDDLSEETFKRNLEAGVKRFASGFTKTLALVTPPPTGHGQFGMGGPSYSQLQAFLSAEYNVQQEDLSDGSVSGEADLLLLVAPKNLDEKQLFAVDQFLMKGGTVVAATSPYSANLSNRSLSLQKHESGLTDWLNHHGLKLEDKVVLDQQNAAFPVPVTRNVGGFQLQEIRMLDYPYFADLRDEGLSADNPITADIPQATFAWASPIEVDEGSQSQRHITKLAHSSEQSWLSSSTDIMPRIDNEGLGAFRPEGEQGRHLLAVISEGRFDSFFAGKESPLLEAPDASENSGDDETKQEAFDDLDKTIDSTTVTSVIERSPESARIILLASNDFLRDDVVQLAGAATGSEYLNTLQLMANAVDWSLEDAGLLSIRSRGHFNRTLPPMERDAQLFWEYINYTLAVLAIALVALVHRQRKKARERRYLQAFAQ